MRPSTILRAGFLGLSVAEVATPGLAQTGAPAGSDEDRSLPAVYPAYLAPGAVIYLPTWHRHHTSGLVAS